MLQQTDLSKLPEILTNCTEIATESKILQDSLTKQYCGVLSGKIKGLSAKQLKKQLDANTKYMNRLGDALAQCQGNTFTPWTETTCKGPFGNWPEDKPITFKCMKAVAAANNENFEKDYLNKLEEEIVVALQGIEIKNPSCNNYSEDYKAAIETVKADLYENVKKLESEIIKKKSTKWEFSEATLAMDISGAPTFDSRIALVKLTADDLHQIADDAAEMVFEENGEAWATAQVGGIQMQSVIYDFVPILSTIKDLRNLDYDVKYTETLCSENLATNYIWERTLGIAANLFECGFAIKGVSKTAKVLSDLYKMSKEERLLTVIRRFAKVTVQGAGKTGLLSKLSKYTEFSKWINKLDEVADAALISKIDNYVTANPSKLQKMEGVFNAPVLKNQQWDNLEGVFDGFKRAESKGVDVEHLKFSSLAEEGSDNFIMKNAKQYQSEASGDAALSFKKGNVSFDNVDDAGKLIDRKYGHGASVFKEVDNGFGGTNISIINNNRATSIIDQATRQINAAGGTPIKWEISTELGAKGIRKLFDLPANSALKNIEVAYVPQIKIIN